MDTNSNTILSTTCCASFEKCAREAASLGALGQVDRVGGAFLKLFPEPFFRNKNVKWTPRWHQQSKKSYEKRHLKRGRQNILEMC